MAFLPAAGPLIQEVGYPITVSRAEVEARDPDDVSKIPPGRAGRLG